MRQSHNRGCHRYGINTFEEREDFTHIRFELSRCKSRLLNPSLTAGATNDRGRVRSLWSYW